MTHNFDPSSSFSSFLALKTMTGDDQDEEIFYESGECSELDERFDLIVGKLEEIMMGSSFFFHLLLLLFFSNKPNQTNNQTNYRWRVFFSAKKIYERSLRTIRGFGRKQIDLHRYFQQICKMKNTNQQNLFEEGSFIWSIPFSHFRRTQSRNSSRRSSLQRFRDFIWTSFWACLG